MHVLTLQSKTVWFSEIEINFFMRNKINNNNNNNNPFLGRSYENLLIKNVPKRIISQDKSWIFMKILNIAVAKLN